VLHTKTLPGNPYDGHTLKAVIEDTENSPAALSRAPLSTRDTAAMMWKTGTASSSRARSATPSSSQQWPPDMSSG